jgi:hypothetical protein
LIQLLKLKQFWIIFFEKSQPPPFPVKWSVPNKSVTTTNQDISHTTLETQNQQVYPNLNVAILYQTWTFNGYTDPIRHKFSIAHTTTDHVITVKNHQTQSQTKYGKNQ